MTMQKISKIDLGNGYTNKLRMREALYRARPPSTTQARLLEQIGDVGYGTLVSALLNRHLSFTEAFTAGCYALRASNAQLDNLYFRGRLESFGDTSDALAARELLSGFAMKEAWAEITPEEVAGLVTAAMLDVVWLPDYGRSVIETGGMGGDKGVYRPDSPKRHKTINGSTLSALVLAALGVNTAKHGSYGNTTPSGSTNAIEALGIQVDTSCPEAQAAAIRRGFHFTDAHGWKTIHDLSHLPPRRETVNHVIGPMTGPIGPGTRLNKIIGVSDKVHPSVIARAYELLHEHEVFQIGNAAVVAGLSQQVTRDELQTQAALRSHVVLDELSPVASAVALVQHGRFVGMFQVTPLDFGVSFPDPLAPYITTDLETVCAANRSVLAGELDERQLVDFLAMNAALGLYLHTYMDDDVRLPTHGPSRDALRFCFQQCRDALTSGIVQRFVTDLVAAQTATSRNP